MLMMTLLAFDPSSFDHSSWNTSLQAHASPRGVDYAAIGPTGLDPYLKSLETADVGAMGRDETMAFWINAYNALTIDLVAENPGIASIRDLDDGDPWSVRRFPVAGKKVTLNTIEHQILRPMGDPRVHAAINCASKGCPPLVATAFTAEGLDAQLDAACSSWVRVNAVKVQDDSIALSAIFDWFGDDFVPAYGATLLDIPGVEGKAEAGLNFVAAYSDPEQAKTLRAGGKTVTFADYDWSLNKR